MNCLFTTSSLLTSTTSRLWSYEYGRREAMNK